MEIREYYRGVKLSVNVDRKIKILHLIESLGSGGAEKLLVYGLKHINRDKFSVKVVSLSGSLNLKGSLENDGIPVYCLNVKNLYNWHEIIFKLWRLILKEKPDIAHTHLFFANIYGRIAAKIAGVKNIITTLHNPDYTYENNNRWTYKIRKLIDKYTGKLFNAGFIAVSDFVKKDFEKQLGFNNIKVIYNCVDISRFDQDNKLPDFKREELGFQKDDIIILNIGRLHPQKGQFFLIEAFNLINKENNKCKLIIIGKGILEDALKNRVKELNLDRDVVFLKDRQDIPDIMKISHIFVFPSNYEGFGIALVEAMASGLPVVASDIDALKEIIYDKIDGILVKKGDYVKLKEVISILIDKEELRHYLGRNAKEKAIKLFNSEIYVRKMEVAYQKLLHKIK